MFRPRVIPVLLLRDGALVKSVGFRNHKYIGDPVNAVRIFNDLKADELVFLDIGATKDGRSISPDFVSDVGEEAQMPFAVGGGITSLADIKIIVNAGAERVVISTAAVENPTFIREACDAFGSTTIIVCIDVRYQMFRGRRVRAAGGTRSSRYTPIEFATLMEEHGAGELIIQSVDRDGTMGGYDIDLIRSVADAVSIPVVALGGAGTIGDLRSAHRSGHASGLAASSLFVFQSKKRGVLINYPGRNELTFD